MKGKLYSVWLFGVMAVLGVISMPLMPFGPRAVLPSVRLWINSALWGLRLLVGVRVEFRGLEHAPKGAALIAGKHMSMLDTLAPFRVLDFPCFVLKRELLRQPVFGAYMKATRMIPIDREAHVSALPLYHIPKNKVARIESHLRSGDIIGITTHDGGLIATSHVGLALRDSKGVLHFMHASSPHNYGHVIVDDRLSKYLNHFRSDAGIIVARPAA